MSQTWKFDKLKDAVERVLDEAETKDQRLAAVWEQHERDGHLPKIPDCTVCLEERGSEVRRAHSRNPSNFVAVENKSGLVVSRAVFQLIDEIAACKQAQAFHGAKLLRILSDQGTELVNKEFENHVRQRGLHLATPPAPRPQSNGLAERHVGLAKQTTRRLLLSRLVCI